MRAWSGPVRLVSALCGLQTVVFKKALTGVRGLW